MRIVYLPVNILLFQGDTYFNCKPDGLCRVGFACFVDADGRGCATDLELALCGAHGCFAGGAKEVLHISILKEGMFEGVGGGIVTRVLYMYSSLIAWRRSSRLLAFWPRGGAGWAGFDLGGRAGDISGAVVVLYNTRLTGMACRRLIPAMFLGSSRGVAR